MSGPENRPSLAALMGKKLESLSETDAMDLIGSIIDIGGDAGLIEALDHAVEMLDHFVAGDIAPEHKCRAHYFRANVWSAKRHLSSVQLTWVWQSDVIDCEILELRRALAHPGFADLPAMGKAQIYTNLGNVLNHVGRFIEAIEYWDRALTAIPKFAIASGNRGVGLAHYGGAVYDPGHEELLMLAAHRSLAEACDDASPLDNPDNAAGLVYFRRQLAAIDEHYNIQALAEAVNLENHSLGRGKTEREYRRWCLANRLFVNPLNDMGPYPVAAQDVMTLPSIIVGLDEGPGMPAIIHYFNIIKQEFCAARYALYEGMNAGGVHFSDRGVLLYNTLDYPAFGFAVERMKMAFRGAYAVFDKSAFLLNTYLKLGIPDRQVNFRNLWFVKGKGMKLHSSLDGLANWPLRGLFWLSKDIFEDDFREVTEPDAQMLYELRNHMEHKFVTVHEMWVRGISPETEDPVTPGIFEISVTDLIAKTLRQLKLARATIIYLSLGVQAEERRRDRERDPDTLIGSMALSTWNDAWKRQY